MVAFKISGSLSWAWKGLWDPSDNLGWYDESGGAEGKECENEGVEKEDEIIPEGSVELLPTLPRRGDGGDEETGDESDTVSDWMGSNGKKVQRISPLSANNFLPRKASEVISICI